VRNVLHAQTCGMYPTVCTFPSTFDRAKYEPDDPLAIILGCMPSRMASLTPWTKLRAMSYGSSWELERLTHRILLETLEAGGPESWSVADVL
jgi:hypothetical protein